MATISGQLDLMVGPIRLESNLSLYVKSHGASGMLDPENVVFYHPLDNKIEYTLTEIWDGTGVFVSGIISSGVSTTNSDAILFGPASGAFEPATSSNFGSIDLLDTDKVIIIASVFDEGVNEHNAIVASLSGFNITYGSSVNVRTEGDVRVDVTALSPSSAVLVTQGFDNAGPGRARVASISGLEITLGSEFEYDSTFGSWMTSSKVDSNRFMIAYQDTSESFNGTIIIGEVSGTTITYGPQFVYNSGNAGYSSLEMIDASGFIITFFTTSGAFSRVGALSGTTVTSMGLHAQVTAPGWDPNKLKLRLDTKLLDSTRFIVAVQYDTDGDPFNNEGRAVIGSISGTTVTFGSGITFTGNEKITSESANRKGIAIALLGSDTGVIAYKKSGSAPNQNSAFSVIFNVSGSTITTNTPSQWDTFPIFYPNIVRLSDTRICGILGTSNSLPVLTYVGEFSNFISLNSNNSNYPKPIGNKNIATFFWGKNPTKNNAQIKLERGYNITFTSGSIILGDTTATWNSPGIQSLMNILNDNNEHSLATYFIHQGGTTWKLFTSVDGEPFVDRETQNTGSQILLTSETNAEVFLLNPDNEDQWLDETVLWAGESEQFNQFNDLELFKLDGLARILDEPMPSFASASFPASASGNLVMPNTFDVLQTSGMLWIEGVSQSTDQITLFIKGLPEKSLNLFIKSHGASGMLDPENVVFYHPLDDKVEHTLTETWDGTGVFVQGAVGSGVSATNSDAILFGPASGAFDASTNSNFGAIDLLDTDKIIIGATVFEGGVWKQQTRVASLSGFNITYGSGITVRTGNMLVDVTALTPSSAILVSHGASDAGKAKVASISGLEITLNSEFEYDSAFTNWMTSSKIDSNRFIVVYGDLGNSNFGTLRIGEVSGTNITYGSEFVYHSGSTGHAVLEMTNASGFIITFFTGSGVFARVGSLSGTTVTSVGAMALVTAPGWDSSLVMNRFDTKLLDSTRFIFAAPYNTGGAFDNEGRALIGSISGTTITFGSGITFTGTENITNDNIGNRRVAIAILGADEGVITYKKSGSAPNQNSAFSVIFNTSGSTIINTNSPAQWDTFEITYPHIVRLSNTRVCGILGGSPTFPVLAYVGEFPDSILLNSSNPNYPEPIGNKNIATFFWGKNPTKNNAQIKLERGYNITFTSGSIALGGTTATWNNSGIQSLMNILNDNNEHSLATYFIHQSGTTWKLLTSVDGESFIDRGVQDVGSQGLLTTKTDAKVFLFNPNNEDQWLDEAVLWAGESEQFNQFNDLELFKLDGLARILDEPMPSFASASFPASASGDLVMPLTFGVLSASSTLLIEGIIPVESGITFFIQGISTKASFEKIVNIFLRTADFHPTIIGIFTLPASGVTIEVWNLIGGVNIQLTIADAICFPIGDTGRFGWSTENLPTENIHDGQYLFRMTDSVGETFVGEFFLNTPESRLF